MRKRTFLATLAAAALTTLAGFGVSGVRAGPVYDGRTVILIVPNSPAGMMTQYARTLVPFLAKHLGAKDVRVENHQGAGSLKGTNLLWHADPDGRTIAFTNIPTLIMAQLAESPGVQFDAAKFTYLGRVVDDPRVVVVGKAAGFTDIEGLKALGRPFVYPSQGTDEDFYAMAVLADSLGAPIKVVTGYEGNADTALAVIKGDADLHMTSWSSSRGPIEAGDMSPLLIVSSNRIPQAPDVPTAVEVVTDPAKKAGIAAIAQILDMSRGFFGPPNMDAAATAEMRAAIEATLKDPELLALTEKSQMPINYAPGTEQQETVATLTQTSASLTPILKAALASIK
jgi:tripartite-type tricarboxylate transporter receptor subunit TctC